MSQRSICIMAATLFAVLSIVLSLFPDVIFWLFAMERDAGGVIISLRTAAAFLALAYLCWAMRDQPQSATSRIVFRALALMMAAFAFVGVFEFLRGGVGPGIALAVGAELFFTYAFWRLARG